MPSLLAVHEGSDKCATVRHGIEPSRIAHGFTLPPEALFEEVEGVLAQQLTLAGDALLVPNACSKRLVQKWERGEHATLTPTYQLALVYLLGCDVETVSQVFSTAHPKECVQQLTTLAQLAESFLALAGAHEKLREFNERLAIHAQLPEQPGVSAVTVSVPYATR